MNSIMKLIGNLGSNVFVETAIFQHETSLYNFKKKHKGHMLIDISTGKIVKNNYDLKESSHHLILAPKMTIQQTWRIPNEK